MPPDFDIEPDTVEEAAERVRASAGTMREAASYAKEADPDMTMWGVIGAPFAALYVQVSQRVQGVLGTLPDALDGVADRIDDAVEAVNETDSDVGKSFDDLWSGWQPTWGPR